MCRISRFGVSRRIELPAQSAYTTHNGTGIEVNGQMDPMGTRSLTARRNVPDTRFYFSFIPAGGWKPGKNEAVILINGTEAGCCTFITR